MNSRSTYAFYGSLRRGMSNYTEYEKGLEFLFQETLSGYRLYALEDYPYAVRTGDPADLIVAEIFKIVNPQIEREIHDLEMSVGYRYEDVVVRGEKVGIYVFEKPGSEPLVKSGDWVQFFGS